MQPATAKTANGEPKRSVGALRWTMRMAMSEMGVSMALLQARLKAAGELPGSDGHYGTNQLLNALYGDINSERLRKLMADRELTEVKRAILAKEHIPRERVISVLSNSYLVIRRAIESLNIS